MVCRRTTARSNRRPLSLLLLASLGQSGCEQDCVGVGCEEDFGSARISMVSGMDVPDAGAENPADGLFILTGTDALGPHWDVSVVSSGIIVGSANDSSVRAYTPATERTLSTRNAKGRIDGARADDHFGFQVKTLFNDDGTTDLLVSAPLLSAAAATRHDGAVYRFSNLGMGFTGQRSTSEATVRITGEWSGGRLGTTLAVCPDMGGDGLQDWMAAAPRDGNEAPLAGQVVLVQSGSLPANTSQTLISGLDTRWTGTSLGEMAGFSMSCSHDLTGDNIADLVIGAPYADTDEDTDASGAVYILDGANLPTEGTLRERAWVTLQPGSDNDWFGWSVATGDFDGDNAPDLAVGAPGTDKATGTVRLWTGPTLQSDSPTTADFSINGATPGDGFGRTVHSANVNGDDIDDLLIGAPFVNPTGTIDAFDAGAVSIFLGSRANVEWQNRTGQLDASVRYEEATQYLRTGIGIFSGDFNSDNHDDIVFLQRTSED